MTRKPRPEVLKGTTVKCNTGCGTLYITLNLDDKGKLFEVWFAMGKNGRCVYSFLSRESILWNMLLQHEVPAEEILKTLKQHFEGTACENSQKTADKRFRNCGDVIAEKMTEALQRTEKKDE